MAKTAGMTFDESGERIISKSEERRVIVASSVGTVFEWYDFYLSRFWPHFLPDSSFRRATRLPHYWEPLVPMRPVF